MSEGEEKGKTRRGMLVKEEKIGKKRRWMLSEVEGKGRKGEQ